jgi:anti-anti-sigma factor
MTASGNQPITVRVTHHDAAVILHVAGELDMLGSPTLSEAVSDALRNRPAVLIVDLTAVRFLSSSGMSALLCAHDEAGNHTEVRVVACAPSTLRPLEVTGLITTISIHPTVQSALDVPHRSAG